MSWFERQRNGREPQETYQALAEAVRSVKATAIVDRACGKFGLRRFLLRFERRGSKVRLAGLETERLKNGGPPDAAAFDAHAGALERMLEELSYRLPHGFSFERGALLVIRDENAVPRLSFRFDEDADIARLSSLREPMGSGIPTEDLFYQKALEAHAAGVEKVRSNWITAQPSEVWSLEGGRLKVSVPGSLERSWRAEAMATWVPHTGDFSWMMAEPVGDEAPLVHAHQVLELRAALELTGFAAAKMGATGVFQGGLEKPAGVLAFLALHS